MFLTGNYAVSTYANSLRLPLLLIATLNHITVVAPILFVLQFIEAPFSSSKLSLEFVPPSPAADAWAMWGK